MAEEYRNNDAQTSSFGHNYGRRVLASDKRAKIVTPLSLYKGFNMTNTANRFQRREQERPIPDEQAEERESSLPTNNEELEQKQEAPRSNGGGNISNIIDKIAKGKKTAKTVETVVKIKNFKIYLIVGGIIMASLLILIILFTVFNASGTEASGMNFNEVSEYELETMPDEEETIEEDTESTNSEVENSSEVENGETN